MSRKVCVVVTARPSYSRIKTVLVALQADPEVELQVVVAASAVLSRYGQVDKQITADGFPISARVFMVLEGEDPALMAKTTGIGISELASVFSNLQPDVVLTIADRFETLSTAVAAAYSGIPLAHVQGGEVTGSIDEKVRHAVTKLADIHFPSTALAGKRVVRMGEDPATVHVTGCPSIDLAAAERSRSKVLDFDVYERYGGVGAQPDLGNGYIVVMQHPVTTEYRDAREQAIALVNAVEASQVPALWFWPNVDAGSDGTSSAIRSYRERRTNDTIHFFKNFAPADFLSLLSNCQAIVGNSSVAIRECEFLGVPAVNIGSRQAGRERGANVVDVGYGSDEILTAIRTQVDHGHYPPGGLYGDGDAGARISAVLRDTPLRSDKRLQMNFSDGS